MAGNDTSTYAPKSPDLSSFYAAPPSPPTATSYQQPQQHNGHSSRPSIHDTHYENPHSAHYSYENQPPYGTPYSASRPQVYSPSGPPPPVKLEYGQNFDAGAIPPGYPPSSVQQPSAYPEYGHFPYQNPPHSPFGQPLYHQDPHQGGPGYYQSQYAEPGGFDPQDMRTRSATAAAAAAAASPTTQMPMPIPVSMPVPIAPPQDSEQSSPPASSSFPPQPSAPATFLEPSPVRTKFPTARIKRIMQADEEVGKVAQQTPIAVGKALEVFMVQMVSKSAEVAKSKGSKRVTTAMLKQVVEEDEQWDFLRDIVSKVENDKDGAKSRVKAESDSDEDPDAKQKGRAAKRKKSS